MEKNYSHYVKILKALGDETRTEIINMLSCGELCGCKILEKLDISQPTLSYHMKILTNCGLIKCRRDGTWVRYSLNAQGFQEIRDLFSDYCKNIALCDKK